MNWTTLPFNLKRKLVLDPQTHPDVLRGLSGDEDWDVRRSVAYNPNTPHETLHKLSEDKDWVVRMGVARNPNTPTDALAKLSEDEYRSVIEAAKKTLTTTKQSVKIII